MGDNNINNATGADNHVQDTVSWGDNTDKRWGLHQPHGVVLGKDDKGDFIVDNRQTHILISASTGGGKSAGPVICTLLNYRESIIVSDIKGDLADKTAGFRATFSDVHVFDPLGSLSGTVSAKINPLLDVMIGREAIRQCDVIAKSLIQMPDNPNADAHWSEKAREWVNALLLYILHCEKIENVHLGRLYELLLRGSVRTENDAEPGFGELMATCVIPPYKRQVEDSDQDYERLSRELLEVQEFIHQAAKKICAEDSAEAIISIMARNLNLFRNPSVVQATRSATFSLRDLVMAARPQTLYLVVPPQDLPLLAPLLRVLFELTSRIIMEEEPVKEARVPEPAARPEKASAPFFNWPKLANRHNVLFLVDESPKLNKLETLEKCASLIRSYGGRIVFSAQSITMLERIYGADSDIFSNCGVKLFLSVADVDEAKKITRYLGKVSTNYVSKNPSEDDSGTENSYRNNIYTQARDLIAPEEVMQLSETEGRETAILLAAGISPLKLERVYYFDYPQLVKGTKIEFKVSETPPIRKFIWHKIDRNDSGKNNQ